MLLFTKIGDFVSEKKLQIKENLFQLFVAIDQVLNVRLGSAIFETLSVSTFSTRQLVPHHITRRLRGKPFNANLIDKIFFFQPIEKRCVNGTAHIVPPQLRMRRTLKNISHFDFKSQTFFNFDSSLEVFYLSSGENPYPKLGHTKGPLIYIQRNTKKCLFITSKMRRTGGKTISKKKFSVRYQSAKIQRVRKGYPLCEYPLRNIKTFVYFETKPL